MVKEFLVQMCEVLFGEDIYVKGKSAFDAWEFEIGGARVEGYQTGEDCVSLVFGDDDKIKFCFDSVEETVFDEKERTYVIKCKEGAEIIILY